MGVIFGLFFRMYFFIVFPMFFCFFSLVPTCVSYRNLRCILHFFVFRFYTKIVKKNIKKTFKKTLKLDEKTIDDDDEPKNRLKTARGPLPETPFSAPGPFWDDFGVPEGSPKSAPGASELLPIFRRISRCFRNAPEGRFLGFRRAPGASGASPGTPQA